MKVIAADIGGTHSRLIYASVNQNNYSIIAEKQYLSADYETFYDLLNLFMIESDVITPVDSACIAVAGPVSNDSVKVTNLPWLITREMLCQLLVTDRIYLINDFVSVAYGVPLLFSTDLCVIQHGNEDTHTKDAVVIGAGTGLGAVHLSWQDNAYTPLSSEAGHSGFAPMSSLQTELLSYLQESIDYVSLEMLLSGSGIYRIYQFLKDTNKFSENPVITQSLVPGQEAEVISGHALNNADELSVETLKLFVEIYGAAASNIALHYYPLSTVYIAGGIAPKILSLMLHNRFIDAFNNKGIMKKNMQQLTVKLVLKDKAGLFGAMSIASNPSFMV